MVGESPVVAVGGHWCCRLEGGGTPGLGAEEFTGRGEERLELFLG